MNTFKLTRTDMHPRSYPLIAIRFGEELRLLGLLTRKEAGPYQFGSV